MSEPVIRPARAADAEAIAPLLEALGYPSAAAAIAPRLGALAGEGDAVLVAEGAGCALVGLIGLHRLATLHAPAPACYITALVVAEPARGRGVGRALLAAGERWARRAGCDRMVVTSAEHRRAAHAFYEGAGFPFTGRRFARPLAPIEADDEGARR